MFDRQLTFLIMGHEGTGKTTLAKLFTAKPPIGIPSPTQQIDSFSGKAKLKSSRHKSFLSFERWRKYKLFIFDTPGKFSERRQWREAFKKAPEPISLVFVANPSQPPADTASALEEIYNQYLESLSSNPEKADKIAESKPFLLYIVLNQFSGEKKVDLEKYYDSILRSIVTVIRDKIPFLSVERSGFNFLEKPEPFYDLNSILERMKRYFYEET